MIDTTKKINVGVVGKVKVVRLPEEKTCYLILSLAISPKYIDMQECRSELAELAHYIILDFDMDETICLISWPTLDWTQTFVVQRGEAVLAAAA